MSGNSGVLGQSQNELLRRLTQMAAALLVKFRYQQSLACTAATSDVPRLAAIARDAMPQGIASTEGSQAERRI